MAYSERTATRGSTEAARWAGTTLAASATGVIPATAAAKAAGSPGWRPKSYERSKRAQATASGAPTTAEALAGRSAARAQGLLPQW